MRTKTTRHTVRVLLIINESLVMVTITNGKDLKSMLIYRKFILRVQSIPEKMVVNDEA